MAVGIITVGTNAGGIPDFLKDAETGFIVDTESPESIAHTVSKIMVLDEMEKEAILAHAKALVLEKYNWEIVAKAMEQMFNNISQKS
jgi:glycosyltransferase involved in cell wall biosynthesis